jgi:Domain of unknown function (DUF4145)
MSSTKPVEPQLGAESFSCPHCGAYAQQYFLRAFAKGYERGKSPGMLRYEQGLYDAIEKSKDDQEGNRKWQLDFLKRLKKHTLTYYQTNQFGETCQWEMANLVFSMCFSCGGFAVWVEDNLIYPLRNSTIIAHEEMPAAIRTDFDEAASIVDKSSRGAAALLRLCIQKLMRVLGEKGKDLNKDIASLVSKGLEVEIQRALDIVRVTGNHAVHPGEIDLDDNKAIAIALFELVNLIVERRIATPQRIDAMFKGLPPAALGQIEKRDAPKQADADERGSD